jgi:hypothetical protein
MPFVSVMPDLSGADVDRAADFYRHLPGGRDVRSRWRVL